ncbi:hypothetical protein DFAR_210003 [Desulfarculales bacterium]
MQKNLEIGALLLTATKSTVKPLDSAEVSFRFKNWGRARAHSYATGMLLSAIIMSWGTALAAFDL